MAVRVLVDEDPNITVAIIAQTLEISNDSTLKILHDHLGLRKITARWVPHLLTDDQKMQRVNCAREFLADFGPGGSKRLSDIHTLDEKWFYYFQIPHKSQNKVWIGTDEDRPTVLRPGFRSRKQMFAVCFSLSGPSAVVMVPNGQNVNALFYTNSILPKVVEHIQENQPARLRTGQIHFHHDNA